ncbi:DegT/DnrJ/EryC1/StrS family aminotransferase [Amycolatopsis rhizosphaerae]|uniref:DegT/DnrJ/EryC1/StrS family aminotransferase n=1 Tax=Amycolatopsis rhizosphaerae TaxID=2053003 RepID=A0A558DKC7_9PSEU|nr:DegT/DnrJ/EryC1/StrS family aminotransferase [Amycolatopsis rhizosphaerae]TVT61460.1 DegT/DnrJ/EryC1/StrS family aminotransferase [Amycolatopsis rhizosphaerae]
MIPVFKVAMAPDAPERVAEVIRSGRLEHGPRADALEAELGRRIGNSRVATVNCATSGLHLALYLLVGRDPYRHDPSPERDEVLTTPLTFEGTNWPILGNGLKIRWVDTDPATLNIDLDDLERRISPRTRAIVIVHWLGFPVDLRKLDAVLDRAERRIGFRPPVVEDCAQAWGATFGGKPLGNHGNTAVYSLQTIKLLTAGGGGLMVFPEAELHRRALRTRWLGIDRADDRARGEYVVPEWGFRFPMNELNAEIGAANLEIVDDLLARHRANAHHYDKELQDVPGLAHTARPDDREPTFWAYPVKVEDRPGFMRRLGEAGIETSIIVRRNDEHPAVAAAREPLPGLDSVAGRVCYLPVGWWLTDEQRAHIIDTVRAGW